MFIAVVGTRLSGKSTVENYLTESKGFRPVRLTQGYDHPQDESSDSYSIRSGESDGTFFIDEATPNPADHRLSFLTMISPPPSALPSPAPGQYFHVAEPLLFSTASEMLEHVTKNWRDNFVTVDLNTRELLGRFLLRPFFMVVSVDAPIFLRFQRAIRSSENIISLEQFVREHDDLYHGGGFGGSETSQERSDQSEDPPSPLELSGIVNLHVINGFSSIPALHSHLDKLDLLNPERLRPGWDAYFMQLASLASQRSNCMKRRVGAILVRNKRILATGYNGTPRGLTNCNEGGCARCNTASETPDECVCLHAEENALLEAGRERIGDGSVLYCNTCPCLKCTIKIIQTGVKEVVYNLSYKVDDASAALFHEAGVTLRRHAMQKS